MTSAIKIDAITIEVVDHQTDFIRSYQIVLDQNKIVDIAIDMIQQEIEESHEGLLEEWGKLIESNPTIDEIEEHLVKFKHPVRLSVSDYRIDL